MNGENYIIKGIGGFYYVHTADGTVECKAKGIFRKRKMTPVAGDRVRLENQAGTWLISEILPRTNVFVRPPIANVDPVSYTHLDVYKRQISVCLLAVLCR